MQNTGKTLSLKIQRYLAACMTAVILTACGGDGDRKATAPDPSAKGIITGIVTNSADSTPIAGALVSVGDQQVTADENGNFTLAAIPAAARAVVRIYATGFSEGFQLTPVVENQTLQINVQLAAVGAYNQINANAGGSVSVPGTPAQVTLPASGIVNKEGVAYNGIVSSLGRERHARRL